MLDDDLYGEITKIIREQTTYLRHYVGQVVSNLDSMNKGRVKATIPELGMITPDLAVWCNARQGHSMSVPKVGAWVEVYFVNGDPQYPVYLYLDSKIMGEKPTNYTGNVNEHVVFESPNQPEGLIKYSDLTKILSLIGGTESFVLGNTLLTEINKLRTQVETLKTNINSWTPVPNDGGLALETILKTPSTGFTQQSSSDFSSILSEKIKGS